MNLDRYLKAQENNYTDAVQELKEGYKHSCWMWYVFPQIAGLGKSPTSVYYAFESPAEAKAYWEHPVLGARLRECCEILLELPSCNARQILGTPDDLKLRSCVTLFQELVPEEIIFQQILDKFYGGRPDGRTLGILKRMQET